MMNRKMKKRDMKRRRIYSPRLQLLLSSSDADIAYAHEQEEHQEEEEEDSDSQQLSVAGEELTKLIRRNSNSNKQTEILSSPLTQEIVAFQAIKDEPLSLSEESFDILFSEDSEFDSTFPLPSSPLSPLNADEQKALEDIRTLDASAYLFVKYCYESNSTWQKNIRKESNEQSIIDPYLLSIQSTYQQKKE